MFKMQSKRFLQSWTVHNIMLNDAYVIIFTTGGFYNGNAITTLDCISQHTQVFFYRVN